MTAWLTVIGIGDGGLDTLTREARCVLDAAPTIFGGERHLSMIGEGSDKELVAWRSPFSASLSDLQARAGSPVAVLATGDPMWFGVGATLAKRFGPEEMRVFPAPSAFSLAAARLGWALADCECLTVHGRPAETLNRSLAPDARLLVYSEDGATPERLAKLLTGRGFGSSGMVVLEHLGGGKERIRETTSSAFDLTGIADLNMVAIHCADAPGVRAYASAAGLPDDAFLHDGKMTKRALRALAIAALEPYPRQVLWDVGAGAGSVSIEWMRAAKGATAFAIEPVEARRATIRANADALGVPEIRIVAGKAPEALDGLVAPDAVFIGGGLTDGVFDAAWRALKPGGRMAVHTVTLESEVIVSDLHRRLGGEMMRVSIERAEAVGPYRGWKPAMPVVHWHVTKGASA